VVPFVDLKFMIFHQGLRDTIDLNFLIFNQGPRDMIYLNFLIFYPWPQDTKNHKISVNKRYHVFYSPPFFRTAGSGGALWVQRDSPDFRAHTHLWARTNLCLSHSSPLCKCVSWHAARIASWNPSGVNPVH